MFLFSLFVTLIEGFNDPSQRNFFKGGDKLFNLVFVMLWVLFWAPYVVCSVFIYVILQVSIKILLEGLRCDNTGYRLKALLKLDKYLTCYLEEEEQMKGKRFDKPHDYVCECDKELPVKEQVRFKVRFLTVKEQAKLRDDMYNVSGFGEKRQEKLMTGSVALKALSKGLLGWSENFAYEDTGDPIPFSEENFSCIPPEERDEIANYIRGVAEEV